MSDEEVSGTPFTEIDRYAVGMVADGAQHAAEDNLNEGGVFPATGDWQASCKLARRMAQAIRQNPVEFRNWCLAVTK
jgi:hypothetical protein